MDREVNEKGRIIYKIVDGLILGYLSRRKYEKAQLGLINDSLWLKRNNPEMPVMFTPTLHEKSLEDIVELFFHYGRFDIPSDFLFMEQQLRQISNQFTECLVNFSQTNRRKMEDRHNRFLLQQRNRPNEMVNSMTERNSRLGEPMTTVPPLLSTRSSQIPQQTQVVKRKAQEEFVYPQRAEIPHQNRFPPVERVENTYYEQLEQPETQDTPQLSTEEHNTSFEAGSSRRKSKPHHLKSDVNTLVTLAATKAQQRLNKEVEDDNWDLGNQFDQWIGQLPPIEEFCMERLWEAAEQIEVPEASSSPQNIQLEENSPTVVENPDSRETTMECHAVEDRPVIRPFSHGSFTGKKISPKENSMKYAQAASAMLSPAFNAPDNQNSSMEFLFGREDGEISNSPAKISEEMQLKMTRREEEPARQAKPSIEHRKREDSLKIRPRTQSQQQRAPSTSSTSSSIASRIEETPPRVEKDRQKAAEEGKERDRRREQDKEAGKQKERERIEREKQKERQKEREKLEKSREARRVKEEKEKQTKDRERTEREQRRERDPQRKMESYAGTVQRRDSRTQSSSSSISEYEPERERERDRRSPRSPLKETKEKEKERAEPSNSRRNTQNFDRKERERREENKDERRRSDSNTQIRKKEMEKSSKVIEASPRTGDKLKEMSKAKKPKANSQKMSDDLLEAIGSKMDSNPLPKIASPRPTQVSPAAGRAKHSDVLSQIFPDAAKFSSTTIKIPKMKLPAPVVAAEIQPTPTPSNVEERENSPERAVQMCIGFPDTKSKNLITKSTMSDSRLACLLANVSKKRERMREEGLDLGAFDPEMNNDEDRRKNSIEESSVPLETSDILENDQPPVKIRRKINLDVAENVLSQIHGLQ